MAAQELQSPPFDLSRSQYDLNSYVGRVKHFVTVTSPLTLLASKTQLAEARQLLADYTNGVGNGREAWGREEQAGIWKAKQLVDSSLHPDTLEPIPLPFRMSAFVPTNLIIVAGMLMPNPTMKSVIFWQWANQSLNVAVNYSNANKSVPLSTTEIMTAYAAATLSSCTIAVGLGKGVAKLPVAPSLRTLLAKFVPFAAVASAGVVNLGCMRWKEAFQGISIFPPTDPATLKRSNEDLGLSTVAGTTAIAQTAASRILCNIPTLILPPLIMTALEHRGAFAGRNGSRIATATNMTLIGTSLLLCLPPAIATFPQRGVLARSSLESKFSDIPYKQVEFNKGL